MSGQDHGLDVSWLPNSKGAEPDEYWVQVGDRLERAEDPSIQVIGLRNGQEYEVVVYAATSAGRSAGSAPVNGTPLNGAEGVVAGLIVSFAPGVEESVGTQEVAGEDAVDIDMEIAAQVSNDAVLVSLAEPVSVSEAEVIATKLEASPQVEWAEPDQFLFTSTERASNDRESSASAQPVSVPADPQYATGQWNLWDSYGIGVGEGSTAMTDAWAGVRGEGVNVAVIDTGITAHPDLDQQLVAGYDFVSNPEQLMATRQANAPPVSFDGDYVDESVFGALGRDPNPADPGDWREVAPVHDSSWHGTKMAGLIAAASNADGITGIAPNAKIQPVRALSWRGGLLSDIAASITWASGGGVDGVPANATPSKVLNLSFSAEAVCPVAMQDAIDGARARGSIVVAAAGNANDDAAKYAPANCNGVIAVGASNRAGVRADYSNYGATVDLSAPGGDAANPVVSVSNTGTRAPEQPSTASDFGTSISAAHVSAAAAILASRSASLGPDEAYSLLTGTEYTKAFANPTCDPNPDFGCGSGILSLAQVASAASGDEDLSLGFNGTNQYAVGNDNAAFDVTTAATFEAWLKPTDCASGSNRTFLRKELSYAFACINNTWYWALSDGANWYQTAGSAWASTGTPALDNRWQHFALTLSGTTVTVYVDGRQVSTGTAGVLGDTSYPLYVGSESGSFYRFAGQLDEVRIYSTARTQSQIQADMHSYGPVDTTGLKSYFDFNEGPAGSAGTGTIYNRATSAAGAANLRTGNRPTYSSIKETANSGSNTVLTFPRSYLTAAGGWRAPTGVGAVDYLVVGGGGTGSRGICSVNFGSGGGGGGASTGAYTLTAGATYGIRVGQGGPASIAASCTSPGTPGFAGQDSSMSRGATTVGSATGGVAAAPNSTTGGSSGSGVRSGVTMQFAGGTGVTGSFPSGGGGGAGGAGSGLNGGTGYSSNISGSDVLYGSGGAGRNSTGFGTVTSGGGSDGNGLANRGGGGSDLSSGVGFGGGGSGVVVLRYATPVSPGGTCATTETSYLSGGTKYRAVAFKQVGTCNWTVPSGVTSVGYIVVAGGGSGARPGAGGGAGGMLEANASLTPGESLAITVGGGGYKIDSSNCATSSFCNGIQGGNSQLSGGGLSAEVIALGGGRGGSSVGSPGNGGSGGGGYYSGGAGTAGQGNNGSGAGSMGGGGGGAGAAGTTSVGGSGRASTVLTPALSSALGVGVVSGSSVYLAGGGSPFNYAVVAGGLGGGGGAGDTSSSIGGDGLANTGGGSGGGGGSGASGTGGSGVVVLTYASTCTSTTMQAGNSTVVEFQGAGSCTWSVPSGVGAVDVLAVGGGGGGGAWVGGGGGGGGVTPATGVDVTSSTTINVTVGAGGRGSSQVGGASTTLGTNGGESSFGSSTAVSAKGGGLGASYSSPPGGGAGVNGGGGGDGAGGDGTGGAFDGGAGNLNTPFAAGGGAGAGGNGAAGSAYTAGDGGIGVQSSVTGATLFYGGGGGGGTHGNYSTSAWGTSGAGGLGGGAAGASAISSTDTPVAASGADGLGGGGGGASAQSTINSTGGNGGDGVVIISYTNVPGAPTSVTASPGPAEATVTWTAPTHIGTSAITGYTVTSSPGAFTCTPSPATATSCTVTGLTIGTSYTFTVKAENAVGLGAASTASSAVVPYGPLDHFAVTKIDGTAVGNQVAGTSFNVKITAQDSGNRTVENYTGTVDVTSTSLFSAGSGTTSVFTAGVLSPLTITLSRAGLTQTITATQSTGGTKTGTSAAFTVSVGSVSKLQVLLPGETAAAGTATGKSGTPTGLTAGSAVTATVNAVDANWNLVTSATPTVAITSSDSIAVLPANAALVSGTKNFSVTLKTAGSQTITASDTAVALTAGTSAGVLVSAATPAKLVVSSIGAQTAGTAFPVTVTLTDTYGNATNNTGATGTVTLTRATGTGTVGGTTVGTIAVGSSAVTITGVTYSKAETGVSLTATGSGSSSAVNTKTGTSATFIVAVGAAAAYAVTLSSTTPTAGTSVTVTAQLQDANGNNVSTSGKVVTWTASGSGGSFGSTTSTTDANGTATVSYTTPTTSGLARTVTATDNTTPINLTGTSTSLTTQVGPAAASKSTLTAASSSINANGSTVVLTVQAKDANGNNLTLGGSTVVISKSSGTGSVGSVTDNGNGTYTATVTAPTLVGSGVFSATLGGSAVQGDTGATQSVTITYTPGTATKFVITGTGTQTAGGSQTITVTAQDANGNTATGYTGSKSLTFSGANSSSSPVTAPTVAGTSFGTATSLTFSAGVATGSMVLYKAESATVSATDGSISSAVADRLSVAVSAGLASSIAVNAGNGQSATAGSAVSTAPSVIVKDAYGNAKSGVSVSFAVATGGGSASGTSSTTDASGIASVGGWTLGTTAGSNTLTATSGSLTGSPVTFTATGNPGSASKLVITGTATQTAGGSQTITVTAQDANGNTATGYTGSKSMTFSGANSSSSPVTAPTVAGTAFGSATSLTFSSGVATGAMVLYAAESATVSVTDGTYSSSGAGRLSVTVSAAVASSIAVNAGNSQSATVGTAVSTVPSVVVKDAYGNAKSGVSVSFAVATGGGSATGTSGTTDSSGIASLGGWTLGTTAGSNTLTATSGSLTGSPVTFTATGTPGAAAKLVITGSSSQAAGASQTVTVTAQDANGNTATAYTGSKSLTFSGANSSSSPVTAPTVAGTAFGTSTSLTFSAGVATGSMVLYAAESATVSVTDGTYSSSGAGRLSVTVSAAAASSIAVNAGNSQSATAGSAVATAPSVVVMDAYGNVKSGVSVSFAVASGGGSATGTSATTNSSGIASVTSWTLGTTAGSNTLTATSASLSGSPVTFTATGTPGSATKFVITGSSSQTAGDSQTITITAQDANGNTATAYTGAKSLTFTGANSSLSPVTAPTVAGTAFGTATSLTFSAGVATGSMVLTKAESATVSATQGSITSATAGDLAVAVSAGAASSIAVNAGNGQSATVGTAVSTAPSVFVKDAYGNVKSGVSVSFAVASGGGSATGSSATTDASGIASVGGWTLGTSAGSNSLTASSGSLTGSPVTFTATGTPGSATKFVITGSATQIAGASQTITITAQDANGNTATAYTGAKSLTFSGANSSSSPVTAPTMAGTAFGTATSLTFSAGVATGALVLYKAESATVSATQGSILSATAGDLAVAVSAGWASSIAVNAGSAQSATAGSAVSTAPSVIVKDAYGNAKSGIAVVFAVASGGGSASGTSATTNSSGIASVGGWTLGTAAGANTLEATSVSVAGSTVTFNATGSVGTAAKLQVLLPGETASPGSASGKTGTPTARTAGASFNITVNAVDANWNVVTTATPTVAITSSDGASVLPSNAALVSGTKSFVVTLKTAGSQTVTATDQAGSPLTAATSASVTVNPTTASKLVVSSIGSQAAGVAFGVTVTLTDTYGNAVNNTGAVGTVTLTRATGTGTLGGTTSGTMAIGSSAVTISGVTYSKAESGVSLTATGTGASSLVNGNSGTSATFAVSAGAAAAYSVTLSSTTPTAGAAVTVTAQLVDADGNPVSTSGKVVTWSASGTGGSFGSASSTTNGSGIATVAYTTPTTSGQSRTVTATDNSTPTNLTGVSTSLTTQVGAASAAQSMLTASSASITANGASTSTLTVQAKDANGNNLTTGGSTVLVAKDSGAGTLSAVTDNRDGTYTATVTSPTATGSAVFSATLGGSAVQGGTGSAQTATIAYVAGTATALVVTGSATQTAGGSQTVTVTAQDANGNTATAYTGSKSLTFSGANSSSSPETAPTVAGTVFGTATSLTFSSGIASGSMVLYAAQVATVSVTDGSLSSSGAGQLTVTVSAASASSIAVNAGNSQSATVGTAVSTAPSVVVKDAFGNVKSGVSVTFAVATGGGSLATSGSVTTNASGIAASPAWTLGTTAGSNTLTATSASLTGSPVTFTATAVADAASQLVRTTSAVGTAAGAAFTTQPAISIEDASGNVVTTDETTVVTATISTGGALVGTTTATAVHGVATFSNLGISGTAGSSYTITFSSGSLASASQSVTVTVGAATSVVLTTAAAGATYGNAWTAQPAVEIRDSGGNVVVGDSSSTVTVSVSAGGTLSGTLSRQVSSGQVSFSGLSLTASPAVYTLTYASGSLVSATQALTLAKAPQSISFGALSAATYGDAPFSLGATATSGLDVSYASSNTAVCTTTGSIVTITGAGVCIITASQPGNSYYLPASSQSQTLNVAQATQSAVTVTSAASILFGEAYSVTASGGSGTGAMSYAVVGAAPSGTAGCSVNSLTGALSYTHAGTCTVTAERASDTNYSIMNSGSFVLTVNRAGQTLAFTSLVPAEPLPLGTYTPTASAVSTVTGLASGITPTFAVVGTCTLTAGVVTFNTTGNCTVTASAGSDTDFTVAASVDQVIVVGSLNQNITFPQPANVAFGSSSFALGATASSNLTVTYATGIGVTACSVSSLGVVTILAVGTCEVVASQAGDGRYAPASDVTRAFQVLPSLPTSPTITSASAGSQAMTVGFTAPGFTGGVAITAYELAATPTGGGTVVTSTACTATPCTITGLTNGTEYTVTLAAINTAGTGSVSAASTPLTPATAAFAVGALSATPGDGFVDVVWTQPTDLGGGTFTRYDLSYKPAAAGAYGTPIPISGIGTTSYRVTGLDNGTSFDFKVVAITSANGGEIPGNTAEVVQYPSTTPSAPQAPQVLVSTPTDVQFSWSPPNSDGGSALVTPYYAVTVTSTSPGAASPITCTFATPGQRFCAASGLTNGAVYHFDVAALNRMGAGALAAETYVVPSSDATLSDLVVSSSAGVVALTPVFDSSVTSYTASVGNAVTSATVTPTTAMGGSTVTVDGVAVISGSASSPIALAVGSNAISVEVTASDPRFTQTTTITITRAAPPPPPPAPSGGAGGGAYTAPASGGGGWTPPSLRPVSPPLSVASGAVDGAATLDGVVQATSLSPTGDGSGWSVHGTGFTVSVSTRSASGNPEPRTPQGRMQVPQGGQIVVNGTGFLPRASVAIYAIPRAADRSSALELVQIRPRAQFGDVTLGWATANASGSVSQLVQVPIGIATGEYVLQVNGQATNAQVLSVNVALQVDAAPASAGGASLQTRSVEMRRAGFFQLGTAKFARIGVVKLRAMVRSIPKDATNVRIDIVGVSTGYRSASANLTLARDRAQRLTTYFQTRGVKGLYSVAIYTSFEVRSTSPNPEFDKTAISPRTSSPKTMGNGKPLTTATISYDLPTGSGQVSAPL